MRDRKCIHVTEGSLQQRAVVTFVIDVTPPGGRPATDVNAAMLCPLCLGYAIGVFSKFEESGIAGLNATEPQQH